MKTIFVKDYDEMSKKGYEFIKEVIQTKEEPVISMTTGGTPRGIFKLFVEDINNGLDIRDTTIMNLDEYIGPKEAVYTVRTFMYENLYNKIHVQPKNIFLIDGSTNNPAKEIARYKAILDQHPRDIQILGLGTNGHIGANEPGTPFDSTMFLAKHEESTIQSTMKEYGITREEVPTEMLTLGFTEIFEAEKVILLVSGKHKAKAVKALLEGEITPDCPATALRNCDNSIVIVDEDAASLLEKK
ncbi:putative glucosamine-6-phosphate deaminase [Caldibacillus thermoamylovorans]|uniref:Putative glucosamine-6-phosphate deaminase n=1 Tax=Caldibacillus thermoamylovorans TaxID=35841 RepID=A0A090IRQ1_9BACI|nr:glucosamine-6-phosphate deaminase [Caldibacillus thermoamylovorans]CEE00332.1 putative glucosamine-6-phosphate deaminase [Caldibacillus thermoamylovorans]